MAEPGVGGSPPTPLPTSALAPAAAVLDQRALGQTASLFPGTILLQNVQTVPPTPDTSVFDTQWFGDKPPGVKPDHEIFQTILKEHNQNLDRFADWRALILATAEVELAERKEGTVPKSNMLETIGSLLTKVYGDANLPSDVTPGAPTLFTPEVVRDLMVKPSARGSVGVFNPWTAWWSGIFAADKKRHNAHVWDPEYAFVRFDGTVQSVQAVTQVETDLVKPQPEGQKWFVSANRLLTEPDCFADANYGINVWSATDDITGYVWKGFSNGSVIPREKYPHIGFLLDSDVLLWLATQETASTVFSGEPNAVLIFVERGMPRSDFSGAYNIRGTYSVNPSGAKWLNPSMFFQPTFKADVDTDPGGIKFGECGFRQCAQYQGRADFKRAEALGRLLNTDVVAIASAKAI